jgi:hypothetical protein
MSSPKIPQSFLESYPCKWEDEDQEMIFDQENLPWSARNCIVGQLGALATQVSNLPAPEIAKGSQETTAETLAFLRAALKRWEIVQPPQPQWPAKNSIIQPPQPQWHQVELLTPYRAGADASVDAYLASGKLL